MKSGRKITLSTGQVVHCATNGDGCHYMDADHWPKDREFDVCAKKVRRGQYQVIVAGDWIVTTTHLDDAAMWANKTVLQTQ